MTCFTLSASRCPCSCYIMKNIFPIGWSAIRTACSSMGLARLVQRCLINSRCGTLILVCNQPPRPTQLGHPFVGRLSEYQPNGSDTLQLESKGRYGSCVVTGKTVWCPCYTRPISERFRGVATTYTYSRYFTLMHVCVCVCVCHVGPVAGDGNSRDGIPFIIEWIPDILPQSHIGEMRIEFEFGHQCNGVIQHRPTTSATATADTSIRQIIALSTANAWIHSPVV